MFGYLLDYFMQIREEDLTHEICIDAITKYPQAIEYIPQHLLTPEMCLYCVKRDGQTFKHLPKELKTEEMCMEAIKSEYFIYTDFPLAIQKSERFILKLLSIHDYYFVRVPQIYMTERIYCTLVYYNPQHMPLIPISRKTRLVCRNYIRGLKRQDFPVAFVYFLPNDALDIEMMNFLFNFYGSEDFLKFVHVSKAKEYKKYKFNNFLMGTHCRLGQESILKYCYQDILQNIFEKYTTGQ